MVTLIIKSYFAILLSIVMGSIFVFILGIYFIFSLSLRKQNKVSNAHSYQSIFKQVSDVTAIAGDDLISTQLDLARAYIETGEGQLAKTILKNIARHGSELQRAEAKLLLQREGFR